MIKHILHHCRPLLYLAFLGTLCLVAACSRSDIASRKLVATVNGEKIYWDEFEKRLNAQKGPLSPRTFPGSVNKRELLEEEILDAMITEKIVLQRAKELNLSVSNTELERKLIDLRKDYGTNFFDLLVEQNVEYDEWREELRKELLFDKLVAADVNAAVHVTDVEAEDAYYENPGLCKSEARVRAAQIVVRNMEKAQEILTRLEHGESFEKVATEVSIGPEAAHGGDLGLVFRQTMPDPIDHMLFRLRAGKISPIVKSDYGYHILKVTEIMPARNQSFPECKEFLMANIRARKEDKAFNAWIHALKLKAVIKKETRLQRPAEQK